MHPKHRRVFAVFVAVVCCSGLPACGGKSNKNRTAAGSPTSSTGTDGTSSSTGGAGGSGGVSVECPDQDPSYQACDVMGTRCEYTDDRGCPVVVGCSPTPALIWFPSAPESGATCDTRGQICDYTFCNIGCSFSALECGDDGIWQTADLCPPGPPSDGESCDGFALLCRYSSCEAGMETASTALCWDCDYDLPYQASDDWCFTVTSGVGDACAD